MKPEDLKKYNFTDEQIELIKECLKYLPYDYWGIILKMITSDKKEYIKRIKDILNR